MPRSETGGSRRRFSDLFERLSNVRPGTPTRVGEDSGETAGVMLETKAMRTEDNASGAVPWPLRVAAAWSWRVLVVAAAGTAAVWAGGQLSILFLPVAIALLLSILLEPLVWWLHKKVHLPKTAAAAVGLVLALLAVVAAISQAASQVIQQVPSLLDKAYDGLNDTIGWLRDGPLKLNTDYVDEVVSSLEKEVTSFLQANTQALATGALSVTSSLASLVSGTLIMLFCLFFFLKEGRRIWLWVVRLLPGAAREPVHESAIRGWVTMGAYVRTQIKVAAIDAIGIGVGAYFLDIPMVIPITVLVFFGSFIPIVGAFISGSIAVLVAVVDQGMTSGLIMLAVILVVQQVEGNVLQPWLMSNAVSLHPVAVLLVVTGAGSVAGIPGAIFGVPIAAFVNATFLYLHGYDPMPELSSRRDRPGGPPGELSRMLAATYAGMGRVSPAGAGTAGSTGGTGTGDGQATPAPGGVQTAEASPVSTGADEGVRTPVDVPDQED